MTADSGRLRKTWVQPLRGRLRRVSRLAGLIDRALWLRRLGSPGESRHAFRKRTAEFTRENARRAGLEHEGQVYSLVPEPEQPPPVRQAWAATEALFGAVAATLDGRGVPVVAVVIPFSKTFEPDWSAYRKRRPRSIEADHGTRRSEEIFSRLGVPVVSVRRRLEAEGLVARELFNRGNRHLSAEGHRWVARWTGEELARLTPDRKRPEPEGPGRVNQ